jgi:glucose-6-phosphate 1-epimerase
LINLIHFLIHNQPTNQQTPVNPSFIMKLSLTLGFLSAATSALAFSPLSSTSPTFLSQNHNKADEFSRPSSTLFASRQKQKIVSRTNWAEARGIASKSPSATVVTSDNNILTNDQGLSYVKLTCGNSSADVYLYGGVVTSYIQNGVEYIAVRPDAKMDGSKPISGGLSHCWPRFGPSEIQQHGFARNVEWNVVSVAESSVVLEMLPNEYTKAMWDKNFKCTFTVTLSEEQLDTRMNVENCGDDSFDFQAALHSYFTVSSLENLEIMGSFAGKEFLNKLVGENGEMQTEERSVITIAEEYDRVYKGVNDPVLKDSGKGKMLKVLNTAGYEDTVVWNPYGNEGMGYNGFVCVESVKFDPVTLAGGESWVGDMSLKPEDL